MILSMTGFGKATVEINNKKITAEIKSLNSKQLDLSIRIPSLFREHELSLRSTIAKELERGKIDLLVSIDATGNEPSTFIDKKLAAKYKEELIELSKELGIPEPADWHATLLRLPDVLKTATADVDASEIEALDKVVDAAMNGLIEFREQEGNRLQSFFSEKIQMIQQLLDQVPSYEAERIDKIRNRILETLEKIGNTDYDKNRLEQEMIFYIEKLDITEEKTRLQNHLDYFMATMETGHGQGKKLGFISQEMGREINTLGSKANHAELQRIVVMMKDQLEQIKEQVLNVM